MTALLIRRWPATLAGLVLLVGVGAPLLYLAYRAAGADGAELWSLVFRWRTAMLLGNTLLLMVGVLVTTSLVGVPYAWLTARASLRGRKIFTVLGILPLAIPGYILAFAMLGLGGDYGLAARTFGFDVWRPSGFTGSLFVLTLYTFPYIFLNVRSAMLRLDPALEEVARAHGQTRWGAFRRAALPQLRPAYLSGALLVVLHVIGDFGVVSLMRFETLSFAVYTQSSFDRNYAACLALLLTALSAVLLVLDLRLLRGRGHEALAHSGILKQRTVPLRRWKAPSYLFLLAVPFFGLVLPVTTILTWVFESDAIALADSEWKEALGNTLQLAAGAALLAPVLGVPLIHASVRGRGRFARLLERAPYLGYAIPPLAFGLAIVFLANHVLPPVVYQSFGLLLAAVTLRFLAEAVGPLRSALYRVPERLEEAARALGCGSWAVLRRVTTPLLWRGVVAAMAFVFLATVKELPLTLILSPTGFDTLATNVWSNTEEALFAEAAPNALAIIGVAGLFLAALTARGER